MMQECRAAVACLTARAGDKKGLALDSSASLKVAPIICFSMISGVVATHGIDEADADDPGGIGAFGAGARGADVPRLVDRVAHLHPGALGAAVGAFDLPARQALVPTLVPREHLPNAITLNTIMFQTAAVVGPSLGACSLLRPESAGCTWSTRCRSAS